MVDASTALIMTACARANEEAEDTLRAIDPSREASKRTATRTSSDMLGRYMEEAEKAYSAAQGLLNSLRKEMFEEQKGRRRHESSVSQDPRKRWLRAASSATQSAGSSGANTNTNTASAKKDKDRGKVRSPKRDLDREARGDRKKRQKTAVDRKKGSVAKNKGKTAKTKKQKHAAKDKDKDKEKHKKGAKPVKQKKGSKPFAFVAAQPEAQPEAEPEAEPEATESPGFRGQRGGERSRSQPNRACDARRLPEFKFMPMQSVSRRAGATVLEPPPRFVEEAGPQPVTESTSTEFTFASGAPVRGFPPLAPVCEPVFLPQKGDEKGPAPAPAPAYRGNRRQVREVFAAAEALSCMRMGVPARPLLS